MPHPYAQDDDTLIHEREQADRARRAEPRLCGVVAITVGLADLAYGGPEEGGWYFDTFEPVRIFVVPAARADSLRRHLARWVRAANEGRPSISSVLSEGRYTTRSGIISQPEPQERPYYS